MTSPNEHLRFLELAEEFYQAFRDLPEKAPSGLPISWPRYFMLCHAVELALKAFLLAQGVPLKDLENNRIFGHRIDALLKEAHEHGLAIGPLERSELEQLHAAHAGYWPRYPMKKAGPVFRIEPFEPYVVKLLEAVRAAVRGGFALHVQYGTASAPKSARRRSARKKQSS
ncbi:MULTISPECIES: hypothetical protein [unclassified Bradyrhizobium]|uniref:hypothetical protein n=1 Tax=unclassified Bradyrhizobium TaxID=2631580 RepID=UPI0028E3FF70|nr:MULTISPECIES: hypothetical protein [unclassified Bradyrhizobium]